MYSQSLQDQIQQIGEYVGVDPQSISLLNEILACFMSTLGRAIDARTDPPGDLLNLAIRLMLISDGLVRLQAENTLINNMHYLVGLGFEQTGEILARLKMKEIPIPSNPLDSDIWYTLSLSVLHYLAGGYRVQALSVLRRLQRIASQRENGLQHIHEYSEFFAALRGLYSGRPRIEDVNSQQNNSYWSSLFLGEKQPIASQEVRLFRLAEQIRQRRDVVLTDLGWGNAPEWLSNRSVNPEATDFWIKYLDGLARRGITAFTNEQVGPGFDTWLQLGNDLLVLLPTGSGKTVIGELRSALALAQRQQVVWILPTRALVRQTRRELLSAFDRMNIKVDELPTTEDFIPLFVEEDFLILRRIAVTTPEKLASLLRFSPKAGENLGLVVFDEAQILLEKARGTTAEFVLQQIRRRAPQCDLIFMSAAVDIKDELLKFLSRFGREPLQLISDIRPTRRVYGIITNEPDGSKEYPSVLLYPPGIQNEHGKTQRPQKLIMGKPLPKNITRLNTVQRFVQATTKAGFRTALFVETIKSTETQAEEIASTQSVLELPEKDIARLRVELGRESVIEKTGVKGVVPHHAGLTPLEQTIAEKWLRNNLVSTVVATPTLAQGVNLPFDIAIVTYISRSSHGNYQDRTPIPQRDIMNMLGRAGRAGHVSDGIGLIAYKRSEHVSSIQVLDQARRIFFKSQTMSNEYLGLSRLVARAKLAKVDEIDWLLELGGLDFSEVQSLVAFVLRHAVDKENINEHLAEQMDLFPSIGHLEKEEKEQILVVLEKLVKNIQIKLGDHNRPLLSALERTGLPVEILSYYFSQLRQADIPLDASRDNQIIWVDQLVQTALDSCSSREWYRELIGQISLEKIFSTIHLWRKGEPIAILEGNWKSEETKEKDNRINLGKFLNRQLSLIAQFWGALAVCYEELHGPLSRNSLGILLQQLPTFTREGVLTEGQLNWLSVISGIDRVLAHKLAALDDFETLSQINIQAFLRLWRDGSEKLPSGLDIEAQRALQAIIDK